MDKTTNHNEWLSLQKMLFDIDNKIIQTVMKMQESLSTRYDIVTSFINDMLEKQGYGERYHMFGDPLKTSPQTAKQITSLIKSDKRIHKLRTSNNNHVS